MLMICCREMSPKQPLSAYLILEFHSRGDSSVQRIVIGPLGFPITLADLPRPGTLRWVARRKAEIVAAVEGGLMSRESACAMYALSSDEFLSWQRSLVRDRLAGLRIQSERKRRR